MKNEKEAKISFEPSVWFHLIHNTITGIIYSSSPIHKYNNKAFQHIQINSTTLIIFIPIELGLNRRYISLLKNHFYPNQI